MITVEHLTKRYGDFTAVKDLSFEIEEGHIYGFLGPNGAGKSTTMNMMTGCLSATEGQIKIDGLDIFENARQAKKRIGYLPEQPPLYMSETPEEYLRFVGEAKGLSGKELTKQIDRVIRETHIEDVRCRRIQELSKGYKQRVGIAQAILGNPQVIILDEPTVGLDPIQILDIRELIRELGKEHTVILSSHILSEVQAICEKILIIAKGELIAFDTPEQLERRLLAPADVSFEAETTKEKAQAILKAAGLNSVEFTQEQPGRVSGKIALEDPDADAVCRRLFFGFANEGIALLEMSRSKANLEDIFLELTEDAKEADEAQALPELEQEGQPQEEEKE